MQARLPMIADQGQFAASGALATYGIDRHASSKRLAHYVDRVLNGVKPADLPIEQPTRFRLIINVRTAKALGLTVPTKLLFTADEVIEYLPRPRGGVAQGQCRPRQPRSIEGDVGHRALPHGGARRPCRALREVRAHSHRLQLLPYGQIQ
jgi:hypothetical protein